MKCISSFIIFLLGAGLLFAEKSSEKPKLFSWNLLYTGSWEESKTFNNRADFRISWANPGLSLRGQVIDRRPLDYQFIKNDFINGTTNASTGLYHKPTGSRLLYGMLDEWGLPARIRSPWIRSAPYTENHKPMMTDLRTSVSATKDQEAYLYLSSPILNLKKTSLRTFSSAQIASAEELAPAFSFGLDTRFGKYINLLLEGFYTGKELPAKKGSAWFSDPPSLPARDFRLYAGGISLNTSHFSFSSDFAFSQTFFWGNDLYGNLGLSFFLPVKKRPLIFSFAADGMGSCYVGRDGTSPAGGKRLAGKIEWKGPRSSLFRINTSTRSPSMEDDFNRSSTGIYYRFPALSASAAKKPSFPIRINRISLNMDRNASDFKKINDSINAGLGLSIILPPMKALSNSKPKRYPINLNFTYSYHGLADGSLEPENNLSPYPFFNPTQDYNYSKTALELLWSPGIFQFRTRWAFIDNVKKDDQWESSISIAVRFKYGRFNIKAAWPDFPEKWNLTFSWRVEALAKLKSKQTMNTQKLQQKVF